MNEPNWAREIIEVHDILASHTNGSTNDLTRLEAAFADDFTFVGPDAVPVDRATIMAAIDGGQGQSPTFEIETVDHTLVFEDGNTLVAEYVEVQTAEGKSNRRLSTVIFAHSTEAPNGLLWRRVHETWIDQGS